MRLTELRPDTIMHVNGRNYIRNGSWSVEVEDGEDLHPTGVKRIGRLYAVKCFRRLAFKTFTGMFLLCDVHVHRSKKGPAEELSE